MPDVDSDSENIAGLIEQENATAISKIRSLFVETGFPGTASDDAESAFASEIMKDGEA
jgi:hypothetical protein